MHKKILPLISLAITGLILSGCATSQAGNKEANLLGVVKFEGSDYTNSGHTTFAVSSDEVIPREDFSGNKVTLFWGLVTLKDY